MNNDLIGQALDGWDILTVFLLVGLYGIVARLLKSARR
jgi:hypothetical protein